MVHQYKMKSKHSLNIWYTVSMHIIHVIPITRRQGLHTLTYFSLHDIPIGSLVFVEVKNKEVPALVYQSESATHLKSLLRAQDYTTKQIKNPLHYKIVTKAFMQALIETAKYHTATLPQLLFALVPSALLQQNEALYQEKAIQNNHTTFFETEALQAPKKERRDTYKTLIRALFAEQKSVFLLAPTIASAKDFATHYARGIEKRVFLLHSSLTKKQQQTLFKKILVHKEPVLIIATKGFLCIPRQDIGLYIVEQEASSAYMSMVRPFFDVRVLIKKLAEKQNAKLLLADSLLSLQTHKDIQDGIAHDIAQMQKRAHHKTNITIINMSSYTKLAKKNKEPYPIFSDELTTLFEEMQKKQSAKTYFLT